jgi:hypothetical protein
MLIEARFCGKEEEDDPSEEFEEYMSCAVCGDNGERSFHLDALPDLAPEEAPVFANAKQPIGSVLETPSPSNKMKVIVFAWHSMTSLRLGLTPNRCREVAVPWLCGELVTARGRGEARNGHSGPSTDE